MGNHQELSRDKAGGACWVTLGDGCIMPGSMLAGMLCCSMLAFCISHQPWICLQRGSGEERSHLLCNCTFVVISAPWESASSEWAVTAAQGWGHDDLSSSFLPSLVLSQCVPRASLTADPRVCPCDHFLGDSCLFIFIGLLVCRVWISWHRWKKTPKHSFS